MITRISDKNAQLYRVLFDKAAKQLRIAQPSTLDTAVTEYFESWDNFEIGSLNEYYAYLQELVSIETLSDDEKRFYVRLPLDEDVFAIDANSRSITVPSSFARNGVGVQGDEMAEVLYFTIDRFFDATDLANSEINIAIQWEAKNANKETITGFSRNFGKDIESIPGKIIFGWPISSELTETNGTIKFAVRFYTLNSNNETYAYSFATLPAEISINATLDYAVNDTTKEIDHGDAIISRIRSDGIYNANMPTPGAPAITLEDITPDNRMYAIGNIGSRIIDLPQDGGVNLAISAQPTSSSDGTNMGVIGYKWKKYSYANGAYSSTPSIVEDNISNDYVEMTGSLNKDYIYYKRLGSENAGYSYEIVPTSQLASLEYDEDEAGYGLNDGSGDYIALFKKINKINVNETGIYTVDINSKILANTTTKTMDLADGITIPGPMKPEVEFAAGTNTTLETDGSYMAHIVTDNNSSAILEVNAVPGEEGKPASKVGNEPNVSLSYAWKKVLSENNIQDITGATSLVAVSAVSSEAVFEPARRNQSLISVVQNGNQVIVYGQGNTLDTFESTDEYQAATYGEQAWIALDIDTGLDSIVGTTWNGSLITSADEAEAASVGLGNGHIVFWARAEQLETGVNIALGLDEETTVNLAISYVPGSPTNVSYQLNDANDQLTIYNLPAENLDETYLVEVTSQRNGVTTKAPSGYYRVTSAPEKPIIKVRKVANDSLVWDERDYMSENNSNQIIQTRRAGSAILTIGVDPDTKHDTFSYVWMKLNSNNSADFDASGVEKLQIDLASDDGTIVENLSNTILEIFENKTGDADTVVEALAYLSSKVKDEDGTNERYQSDLTVTESGIYYCVVINNLNNHINANASPFFIVS